MAYSDRELLARLIECEAARYPLPAVPAFLWFYHLP